MLLEEFVHKFSSCFHQTDPLSIKADTEFRKLDEWGSMMALIVIAMIDEDYGKTITAEDLRRANTVADLFEIVRSK
ncbi:MAG: acyl carrier protein [Chitinophagales bacterium]|nr:acyl carrier protein [Chitinophagales bacterium]MDW8419805.1 acyl carrier protein [Chitinophagales bacterium]